MAEATLEPPVEFPKEEAKHINSMAEKFRQLSGLTLAPEAPAAPVEPPAPTPTVPTPPSPTPPPNPATPAPAPAPVPTPTEPTPPPEMKGKAREAWQKLETLMKEYRTDAETYKAKVEAAAAEKAALALERDTFKVELETARKGTAEYEQLKQEYEKNDRIIKELAIEKSPQFQAHFGQRFQTALLDATEAVKAAGNETVEKVKAIMEMPPSDFREQQIRAIGGELDDFSRASLATAYNNLKATERERAVELSKPIENHKKLMEVQAREQAEQQARDAQVRATLVNLANTELAADLNGFAGAEAIKAEAKKMIMGEASTPEFMSTIKDAALWRRHAPTLKEKDELIGKLQAQLAELQTATPTLQTTGTVTTPKVLPPLDHSDIGEKFRKLTQQGR